MAVGKVNYHQHLADYQEKLTLVLSQIKTIKQNKEFDLFKFGIIAFICAFFSFILVDNTLKTIRVYLRARKTERFQKPTVNDENNYISFENDVNYKNTLTKAINKSKSTQNNKLINAKLELIASQGKQNTKPEDYKLEADIDMNSIDRSQDNYNYSQRKTDKSFWDMMFVKKNYSNI
jgi:hypothetical protein